MYKDIPKAVFQQFTRFCEVLPIDQCASDSDVYIGIEQLNERTPT